jgi:hypothetical protein
MPFHRPKSRPQEPRFVAALQTALGTALQLTGTAETNPHGDLYRYYKAMDLAFTLADPFYDDLPHATTELGASVLLRDLEAFAAQPLAAALITYLTQMLTGIDEGPEEAADICAYALRELQTTGYIDEQQIHQLLFQLHQLDLTAFEQDRAGHDDEALSRLSASELRALYESF